MSLTFSYEILEHAPVVRHFEMQSTNSQPVVRTDLAIPRHRLVLHWLKQIEDIEPELGWSLAINGSRMREFAQLQGGCSVA